MAEGKYVKVGGAIKLVTAEYVKVGGAIKQVTSNVLKIGGGIKAISVGEQQVYVCEQISDRLYGIDKDQNDLDGWPNYGGSIADPYDVAVDADGYSYWGCSNSVYKYDSDGNEVWENTDHTSPVLAICVDAGGYVYSGDGGGTVRCINSSGVTVWTKAPYVGSVNALAVDYSAGQLYAAYGIGAVGRVYRFLTSNGNGASVYYNANGNVLSVAVDEGTPSLYIGDNDTRPGYEGMLRKISTAGYVYWEQQRGGELYDIHIDHDGNGYFVNGSEEQCVKFDLDDGSSSWTFTPSGGAAHAMRVSVDQFGHVFATYKIAGASVYNKLYRLSPAGAESWNWQPYLTAQLYGVAVPPGIKAAGF